MKKLYTLIILLAGVALPICTSAQEQIEKSIFLTAHPEDLYSIGLKSYNIEQYGEAIPYFQHAAERGFSIAQHYYGECFYYGRGVAQNYTEAVKWYRKAAEQGYERAQCNLGYCYEYGFGIEKDTHNESCTQSYLLRNKTNSGCPNRLDTHFVCDKG